MTGTVFNSSILFISNFRRVFNSKTSLNTKNVNLGWIIDSGAN